MFQPSKYQVNVFDFIKNGQGNAVINAVAGSGKTTTIVQGLTLIPTSKTSIFLAFNKAIVEELKVRVPDYVDVQTLHSLGAKAIYFYRRESRLDNNKVAQAIYTMSTQWSLMDGVELDYDYRDRVKKLVDLLRINLLSSIQELELIANKHEIEILNGECERAFSILEIINKDTKSHDFVDMLYLPVLNNWGLKKYDFIFVDECQDLNIVQQKLITLLQSPTSRFIAVGDPRQAIYGFAGADVDSFNKLASLPNTITLPLSISYRCGKNIVNLAKAIVPELESNLTAIDGIVENTSFNNIQDGDMVLCRNTAPLVKMCLEFIAKGRKAYVKGGDIGKNLINIVKKSKKDTLEEFKVWGEEQLNIIYDKLKKKHPYLNDEELRQENAFALLNEKMIVLNTIIDERDSIRKPADLIKVIELIFFDDSYGICFSTIHKSKGLESDRVFIIERDLMPSKYAKAEWQKIQEQNLIYVAYTRAKSYLGFVTDWTFKPKKNK